MVIDPGGGTRIPGYVFLHRDKLPPDVMALLIDRRLLLEGFTNADADVFTVEQRAADLILSHIANEVAHRTGWSTATDRDIEFYFTSLHGVRRETRSDVAQQLLSSTVLMSQVPKNIVGISWRRYTEIRSAYADIRRPLEELLTNIVRQEGLSNCTSFEGIVMGQLVRVQNAEETLSSTRMSILEIAARLEIGRLAVYRMLEERKLPGVRVGKRWIVTRKAFERWEAECGMTEAPGDYKIIH